MATRSVVSPVADGVDRPGDRDDAARARAPRRGEVAGVVAAADAPRRHGSPRRGRRAWPPRPRCRGGWRRATSARMRCALSVRSAVAPAPTGSSTTGTPAALAARPARSIDLDPLGGERADVEHERAGHRGHLGDLLGGVRHHRQRADREGGVGGLVHDHEVGDLVHERTLRAQAAQRVAGAAPRPHRRTSPVMTPRPARHRCGVGAAAHVEDVDRARRRRRRPQARPPPRRAATCAGPARGLAQRPALGEQRGERRRVRAAGAVRRRDGVAWHRDLDVVACRRRGGRPGRRRGRRSRSRRRRPWRRAARRARAGCRCAPVSISASGRFGVTTVASGKSRADHAPPRHPRPEEPRARAGDHAPGRRPAARRGRRATPATASMISAEKSIPVLAASAPMSSNTASSWARTNAAGTAWTARHLARVLRGERHDRAAAVAAGGREGAQVGLDAGAPAGVGRGDGESACGACHRTPYAGMTQIRFTGVISAPRGAPRYAAIYHRGPRSERGRRRSAWRRYLASLSDDTERKRRTISGRRLTAITGLSMRNWRNVPSPSVRQRRRRGGLDGGGALLAVERRHLAEEVAGAEVVDHLAVDDDVGLALEDDEEVRPGETLGEHAVAGEVRRVVEALGGSADLLAREAREE